MNRPYYVLRVLHSSDTILKQLSRRCTPVLFDHHQNKNNYCCCFCQRRSIQTLPTTITKGRHISAYNDNHQHEIMMREQQHCNGNRKRNITLPQRQLRSVTTTTSQNDVLQMTPGDIDITTSTEIGPDLPYDTNENTDLSIEQSKHQLIPPTVLNGQLAVISFYDSFGDYNKDEKMIEEYMEEGVPVSHREVMADYNEGDTIPLLPIPSVDDTLVMLESSCVPLCESETELCEFILASRKALLQPVVSYQKRLLRRGDKAFEHSTSWLQLWWNTICYLKVRTPNVIHSSYFFRFPKPLNLGYNNVNNIIQNFIDDIKTSTLSHPTGTTTTTNNDRFHSETVLERATVLIYGALSYTHPIIYGKGIPIPNPARIKGDQHLKSVTPLLCAAQYKYMFGACRIPGNVQDAYRLYQFAPRERSKLPHITVVCRGQFYNLIIGDFGPDSTYELKPSPGGDVDPKMIMHMIHDQLIAIVQDAQKYSTGTSTSHTYDSRRVPDLGWLTTQNRDTWYEDYQWLIQRPTIHDALHTLQSSLFVLCLDDIGTSTPGIDTEADRDFALRLWHGGRGGMFRDASKHMGGNRWYDKSIQIVMTVDSSGNSKTTSFGVVGEHSMADGMPVAEFSRFLNQCEDYLRTTVLPFFNSIDDEKRKNNHRIPTDNMAIPTQEAKVHNIFQDAYTSLSEMDQQHLWTRVKEARFGHIDATSQYDLQIFDTSSMMKKQPSIVSPDDQNNADKKIIAGITGLGSQFLKIMKISPDAGIQMVMQLAAYRYFGRTVATYESTHTRRLRHGRTETIRSLTAPSREFCRDLTNALKDARSAMPLQISTSSLSPSTEPPPPAVCVNDLDDAAQEEVMKIFRRACATHASYSRLAADGRGCDRHLFGLELLANRTYHDRIREETQNLRDSGAPADAELSKEVIRDIEKHTMPMLFQNPVYIRSKHWRLSTSTLPGTAPGFGPVVDDGFGIGYDIRMNHVIFTITGLRAQNDVVRFCYELEHSMVDIYQLLRNAYTMREHLQHREKHDLLRGPAIMPRYYANY